MREGSATEIFSDRQQIGEGRFTEIAIWEVPKPKAPSTHPYKYRLAFIVNDVCVIRYDNESGKGDHRHAGAQESRYAFASIARLLKDFWADVESWRERP
jgi:hypothetical protein